MPLPTSTSTPAPHTPPKPRAPLEQLQARFDMRRHRPDAEHVSDEVESALAAEAAGLAAVARQLQRHEAAVGEQVRQLRDAAAALRPGIDDRAAAEEVEELAARLDGREALDSPRAPSIVSVCASTVSGYSTLGESASQVCAAPSIRGWPAAPLPAAAAAATPHRRSQHTSSHSNARHQPNQQPRNGSKSEAGASDLGGSSVVSSGAVRGAVTRIAALEKELADAKRQTCHLEEELRDMQRQQQQYTAVAQQQGQQPLQPPTASAGGSRVAAGSKCGGTSGLAQAAAGGVGQAQQPPLKPCRPVSAVGAVRSGAAAAAGLGASAGQQHSRPMTATAAARLLAQRGWP